jgi:hypothetical protein
MSIKNLSYFRNLPAGATIQEMGARLYEAIADIDQQIGNVAQQTNSSRASQPSAPPKISALNVTAADGIFDAKITDTSASYRGIEYFLEHSPTPHFSAPTVIHLGTTRNWRGALGNQSLYWRAYSGYSTSPASAPVYHGGAQPKVVVGGGQSSGPPMQASSGSGTATTRGNQGGSGYGKTPFGNGVVTAPVR